MKQQDLYAIASVAVRQSIPQLAKKINEETAEIKDVHVKEIVQISTAAVWAIDKSLTAVIQALSASGILTAEGELAAKK
ncbi:MAG: hypothetical protein ACK5L3_10510 [Oscillospiraceae bacterium]